MYRRLLKARDSSLQYIVEQIPNLPKADSIGQPQIFPISHIHKINTYYIIGLLNAVINSSIDFVLGITKSVHFLRN